MYKFADFDCLQGTDFTLVEVWNVFGGAYFRRFLVCFVLVLLVRCLRGFGLGVGSCFLLVLGVWV